jgi:hypothetical protein
VIDLAIPVSAKRWALAFGLGVLVLVAASIGASFVAFVPLDDPFLTDVRDSVVRLAWFDGEGNIPAWYSASLLLLCALLLAAIAAAHRQQRTGPVVRWLILSSIFVFLSLDEIAQLHELSIRPLRDTFHTTGFFYYGWIIPAGVCVALFTLAYLPLLRKLPSSTRWLFLLAGSLYVGGALGVEAVSGRHASLHGEHNLIYHLIVTVEELLEMAGLVVFIYALLDYIGRRFPRLAFNVAGR